MINQPSTGMHSREKKAVTTSPLVRNNLDNIALLVVYSVMCFPSAIFSGYSDKATKLATHVLHLPRINKVEEFFIE